MILRGTLIENHIFFVVNLVIVASFLVNNRKMLTISANRNEDVFFIQPEPCKAEKIDSMFVHGPFHTSCRTCVGRSSNGRLQNTDSSFHNVLQSWKSRQQAFAQNEKLQPLPRLSLANVLL